MAKKSKGPRVLITLECIDCKSKNYHSQKNKRNTTERVELKKLCKKCKKPTVHKEAK